MHLAPVHKLETNFWQGVTANRTHKEFITPVFGAQKVCCVRFFPRPKRKFSDLILGYIDGRFSVHILPWKFLSTPVTTAVSKPIPTSGDRSPLIDIRS